MTFKQIIVRFVLPLTLIAFSSVTKWWFVLPVDAPDTMMLGFPLAFVADGWFSSMSLQVFVLEFFVDFACYFLCMLLLFLPLKKFIVKHVKMKQLTAPIWILALLLNAYWLFIFGASQKHIKLVRDWNMQLLDKGYKFTWSPNNRPDLNNYDYFKK